MRRARWIIALTILFALLAAEVLVRRWERPRATVEIINKSDSIMEDLVIFYADTRMPVGRLLKGEAARIRVTAGPPGPLKVEYRQKSNSPQGLVIPDFTPLQNIEDGFKQMVVVGTNQVQRYVEDDEGRSDQKSWRDVIRDWFGLDL